MAMDVALGITLWPKKQLSIKSASSGQNFVAPACPSRVKSVHASTNRKDTPEPAVSAASSSFFSRTRSASAPHMGIKHMATRAGTEVSTPICDSERPICAK